MRNLLACLNPRSVRFYLAFISTFLLVSNGSWGSTLQPLLEHALQSTLVQSITCPEQLLLAFDGQASDKFGNEADIDGDTIVVGAPFHAQGGLTDSGAAYVYVNEAGAWTYKGKLTPSDGEAGDWFAYSVAVSGDCIAVGCSEWDHAKPGLVYMYEKPAGGWTDMTETAKLTVAGYDTINTTVGIRVEMDGDTVVAGNFHYDIISSFGEAYVFVKPAGGWVDTTEVATLTASDRAPSARFGTGVSIYGDTIAIGSNGLNSQTGAAYLYEKPAGGWTDMTETAKLTASDGQTNSLFGSDICIVDDTVAVGAYWDDPSGAAYVFVKPAGGWITATETAKLLPSDLVSNKDFGHSVEIEGDRIYVGAFQDDENATNAGAVYYFDKPAGGWTSMTETAKIIASNADTSARMGKSVRAEGTTLVAGADQYYNGGVNTGAVYLLDASNTPPQLSLEPTDIDVYRCEEREITVHLSEADGVVGYRIALNYDPAQVTYVGGSATITGTDCEGGWFSGIVNDASPGQVIFTSASLGSPLSAGPATLVKFTFQVNCLLPDFEVVDITFDETLTNINDGAIAVTNEPWAGEVDGPNIPPSFTPGSDINILEDFGTYSAVWATDITSGTDYEDAYQSVWFEIDSNSNPGLFGSGPSIDSSGTLSFTTAADEYGAAVLEVTLHDDGGTANGGVDVSPTHTLTITLTPVNDPPSFTIVSATAVALNESAAPESVVNFASDLSTGPANESAQTLTFTVISDHAELFDVLPAIDASGTLTFTPAAGAHGVAQGTVSVQDNGGIANGGIDSYGPASINFKIYVPYLWGELSGDGIVGAVDAWNALLFYVGLIDEFPAYPPADYPEYYPGGVASSSKFPPAGDVNWDGALAALDASLILQQFALLIDYFPADLNEDDWGPDAFYPGDDVFQWAKRVGTRRATYDERSVIVKVKHQKQDVWRVSFSLDRADEVLGFRFGLKYNPDYLSVEKSSIQLSQKDGMLVVNDRDPGVLILSGAFLKALPNGKQELFGLEFTQLKAADAIDALTIEIDDTWTDVNDGHIDVNPSSLQPINLEGPTNVNEWMLHR